MLSPSTAGSSSRTLVVVVRLRFTTKLSFALFVCCAFFLHWLEAALLGGGDDDGGGGGGTNAYTATNTIAYMLQCWRAGKRALKDISALSI